MNRMFACAGWVAAVAATAAAVWFALDGQRKTADMHRVDNEIAALRADLKKARTAMDELTAKSEAAEAAAKAAKTDAPKTPGGAADSPGLFDAAMGMLKDSSAAGAGKKVDVAGLMKGLMKANGPESPGGIAAMFEGPQGEQMMDMSAKFATSMQYDPFVNGLQIPAEQKQQVRDILTKFNSEIVRKSVGALQGKGDFAENSADANALKEQMRAELKTVLGADGLDQFDAYQTEMPERMLNQSMDMQLGLFAGGLTPENKTMVRDVLVQELLPGQHDPTMPKTPDQVGSASETQRAAFDRALQRLQPDLPPDQYAEVESFVRQQQDIMDMVTNMMPKPAADGGAAAPAAKPAQ